MKKVFCRHQEISVDTPGLLVIFIVVSPMQSSCMAFFGPVYVLAGSGGLIYLILVILSVISLFFSNRKCIYFLWVVAQCPCFFVFFGGVLIS